MHWLSFGVALLVSAAIIVIGILYLLNPRGVAQGFGLPMPEEGRNIAWWLRLKGVRDIVSGAVVLATMHWGDTRILGIVLFIEAFTALGDMSVILAARGSTKAAFGMHGLTAAVMIAAAIPLIMGVA
jgi:hypothetical protein